MTDTDPIAVRARIVGYLQWICPSCTYLHGSERLDWRSGRVKCRRCERTYLVGLAFLHGGAELPPFNARWMPKQPRITVNTHQQLPGDGRPAIARVVGDSRVRSAGRVVGMGEIHSTTNGSPNRSATCPPRSLTTTLTINRPPSESGTRQS